MIDERKNSLKYSSAWFLSVLLLITYSAAGNYTSTKNFYKSLTAFQDTSGIRKLQDTIPSPLDSLRSVNDTFSVQLSKDSISSPISYRASDSMVLNVADQRIILFSKANIKQDDMDLSADSIELDQASRLVVATFRVDSLGNIVGRPKMIQAESTMESDVIRYNFESGKGITQNTITQQGEIYIQGEKVKKISVSEFFAYRGQFTTCNLDVPHFAFRTKKLKLINQKLAVSGPIHPEFEGVPVPVYIPFGFFPISQGRHSGILTPSFTTSEQFGLGLQGLGYYKVLNDYFDVTLRSDIYSYGGWAGYLTPTYRVRYRYSGSMNLTVQKSRFLSPDPKEEYSTNNTFNITWSHIVDSKARPGQSFSANVNAGSTQFNRFVLNNPTRNFSNNLNSSITYSKTWEAANLTVSANHSQNSISRQVNLGLPNVAFTANTIYPFQPKEMVGPAKWYQKLGIGLNSNMVNRISFIDSMFSIRRLLDTLQWGAQHNIPIQLSLPSLGPVQISPGINYQEKWHSQKLYRSWNSVDKKVDSTIEKGFYTSRDISFSLSLSSAIFGTFDKFGPKSSVRAIRHVIRPTMSISYRPDLSSNDFYVVDTLAGRKNTQPFSYYDGSVFGPYSPGEFGGLSFGIDNNLEMKARSKKDTTNGGIKKVRLIDGFGINGSYNFLADSLQFTPISVYLRSTLFEKINITAGASLDPYQVNASGNRINTFVLQEGGFMPGRITNGNIAISTSFRSKEKKETKTEEEEDDEYLPPVSMEQQMAELEYIRQNPAEFADFNIPWSVNLSYSLSFNRLPLPDYSGFSTQVNSNVSMNGDFNLSPKWKVIVNTYYDFKTTSIQSLTMSLAREMHCWQLAINVTPVGLWRSFNITINPKSGLLRDLRINRTRQFGGF